MAAASRTGSPWLLNATTGGLKEAVRHKTFTGSGSNHKQRDAKAPQYYDGSSWWIPLRSPGRLQLIKRDEQSKLSTMLATDGHHNVHAQLTKNALKLFSDGIGRPFSACGPGEVLSIDDCTLMVTEYGTDEDHFSFLIDKFGLVQGQALMPYPHSPQVEDNVEVKRLIEKLIGPDDVIPLSDLNDQPESQFMSQIPKAHASGMKRAPRKSQPDVVIDRAPNLAEPVAMQAISPSNDQTGRPGNRGSFSKPELLLRLLSKTADDHAPRQSPLGTMSYVDMTAASVPSPVPGSSKRRDSFIDPAPKSSPAGAMLHGNKAAAPASSPVSKSHKRRDHVIDSAQKSILQREHSWQYPLPNVLEASKLLPADILHEFHNKYYKGHLRPSSFDGDAEESGTATGPHDRTPTVGMPLSQMIKKPQSPERRRGESVSSERSDDPVDWSQSVMPSSPPNGAVPSDNVQNEDYRPVDSSNPEQQPNRQTRKAQNIAGSNARALHSGSGSGVSSEDDESSDEDMEESVPYVSGESKIPDASEPHLQQANMMPGTIDETANMRRDAHKTPERLSMSARDHYSNEASPHFPRPEMQVPATVQPTRATTLMKEGVRSRLRDSSPTQEIPDGKPSGELSPRRQPKFSSSGGSDQRSPAPAQRKLEGQQKATERTPTRGKRTRNLGFGNDEDGVENPTVAVRRERSDFLRQQKTDGTDDPKLQSEPSRETNTAGTRQPSNAHDSPQELHHSPLLASSKQSQIKTAAAEGNMSFPGSREDNASTEPGNDTEPPQAPTSDKAGNKTTRRRSDALELPNKKQRLDAYTPVNEPVSAPQSAHSAGGQGSPQSSKGPLNEDDPFVAFAHAYPDYDEGRKHFRKMCHEIDSLGKSLHRSLWDDYVVRNATDYDESCGLSYRDYYDDHVDEPIHKQRILNPASLKIALEASRGRNSLLRLSISSGDATKAQQDVAMPHLELRSRQNPDDHTKATSVHADQSQETEFPVQVSNEESNEEEDSAAVNSLDHDRTNPHSSGDKNTSSGRSSTNAPTTSAVTADRTQKSTQQPYQHPMSSVTVDQPMSSAPPPGQGLQQVNGTPSSGNLNVLSSAPPPAQGSQLQVNGILSSGDVNVSSTPSTKSFRPPPRDQTSNVSTPAQAFTPTPQRSSGHQPHHQQDQPLQAPLTPANRQIQRQRPASTSNGVFLSHSSPRPNLHRASLPAQTSARSSPAFEEPQDHGSPAQPLSLQARQETASPPTAPAGNMTVNHPTETTGTNAPAVPNQTTTPAITIHTTHPTTDPPPIAHQPSKPQPDPSPNITSKTTHHPKQPHREPSLTATFRQHLRELQSQRSQPATRTADTSNTPPKAQPQDKSKTKNETSVPSTENDAAFNSTGNAFLDAKLRRDPKAAARFWASNSANTKKSIDRGSKDQVAGDGENDTTFNNYAKALRSLKIVRGVLDEKDEGGEVDVLAWRF